MFPSGDNALLSGRQEDGEGRALAHGAIDADMAPVILNNREHTRKTQAGPFARFFGGEERSKDFIDDLGWHPNAGIAYPEQDVRTGFCLRVETDAFFVEANIFSL